MTRTGRIVVRVLQGLVALMSALLLLAYLMSDKLTRREVAERIVAADEPCRAAFAKALDLRDAAAAEADRGAAREAARTAEPVCRAAYAGLDTIIIYIPRQAGNEARAKKAAIEDCAALSRARAALLAQFQGDAPGAAAEGVDALNAELARSDAACRASYGRLAE